MLFHDNTVTCVVVNGHFLRVRFFWYIFLIKLVVYSTF
ncbi:unnamed protein product [Acanthoscelides obtectus]|uniref:Uncharacterized protein n=1 Tax=Acanthoscelides obtectus TaxID=200917 RepID=A0A9P0P7M0_ACAOB|nr:unnamed protein product [Acanthoscelides obtectus]CAK1652037.1 hypothetical protein AOBTE_LOCUS17634 [Acanthoscelides obtectus]